VIYYSLHAQAALEKRANGRSKIEEVLQSPVWLEPDKNGPDVQRAFGRDNALGHWIRVVFRKLSNDDILVITVHPDRDANPPATKGN
jgi:hypothetical protein